MVLEIPAAGLRLATRPLLDDQELNLSFRYWEGAVTAEGSALTARGYLELTGYARIEGGPWLGSSPAPSAGRGRLGGGRRSSRMVGSDSDLSWCSYSYSGPEEVSDQRDLGSGAAPPGGPSTSTSTSTKQVGPDPDHPAARCYVGTSRETSPALNFSSSIVSTRVGQQCCHSDSNLFQVRQIEDNPSAKLGGRLKHLEAELLPT